MPLLLSGAGAALLGIVVLCGWYTHNVTLIQVLPSFVPMQYNTALGFLLCGVGLLCCYAGRRGPASAAGAVLGLLGLLTLCEYLTGVDLGIDQLFMEHYVDVKTSHPGRMAPNTALCFLLCGLAVVALARAAAAERAERVAGILGAAVTEIGRAHV